MIQTQDAQALPGAVDEKAKALVPNGDARALRIAKLFLQLDDDSLMEAAGTAQAIVERREREVFEQLAAEIGEHRLMVQIGKAVMQQRIIDRGAKMLPSDTYKCAIERSKSIVKRYDILRGLEGKVPADRLKKALWVDGIDISGVEPAVVQAVIAAGAKPVYNGNATQLKKLASDFGGEIAAIVESGLAYEEGAARLVFEPLESAQVNVTPAIGDEASA